MKHGSLFTGIGLLDYGLYLAGLRDLRWVCEQDEWRRGILAQRFPEAVQHADVRAVRAGTAEPVEFIAGGFPCKGASTAGKRTGFEHPETVLWREMARAVGELRPRYVVLENVANLLALHDGRVWGEVVGTLASLGYDTTWDCIPAGAVGAPHLRDRVFAVAAHAEGGGPIPWRLPERAATQRPTSGDRGQSPTDSHGNRVRQQPVPESGRSGSAVTGRAGKVAAHADEGRGQGRTVSDRAGEPERHVHAGDDADRRGVPVGVEWGDYEPAIRRWEALAGAAPEPLLRGVDARRARRVVRSRLSALGDGVQVQVGRLVGEYVLGLERERLMASRGGNS